MKACWIGLALLASCVAISAPPEDLASRQIVAPEGFGAESTADVVADWLAAFDDASLDALVREAWEHNPDLFAAAARLDEAVARTRIAGSRLQPQLSAAGRAEYVNADGSEDWTAFAGLSASWEVDLWGRLRSDRAAAEAITRAAGFDLAQAQHSLAAAVVQAVFVARAATAQLDVDRELLVGERFTERTTNQRVAAGLGTPLDGDLAASSVALAEAAVQADLAAIAQSRRALELLLGRYPAAAIDSKDGLVGALPEPPAGELAVGVPTALLERRPDVRAASAAVDASFHGIEGARAARLPAFNLTAGLGTAIDPSGLITDLIAGIVAPLSTGGRLQAEIRAAEAVQQQALAQYAKVALRAFAEVESALDDDRFLASRAVAVDVASERLRNASAVAQSRYEAGLLSILDLQQVRRLDFSARSQRIALRLQHLRRRIDLYLALGGSILAPASEPRTTPPELRVGLRTANLD